MNLYFIVAQNGEMNLDWLVIAETPQQAVGLWKEIDTVQDFSCDDEDQLTFPKVKVFAVGVLMPGPPRTYDWHTEVPVVFEEG